MHYTKYTKLAIVAFFLLALMAAIGWQIQAHIGQITSFATSHPVAAPIIVILIRIIGIIIPPIPGGLVSIALIPTFGWFWSYIYAAIGVLIGTSIAFWLARAFREPLVKKIAPLQDLHEYEKKLNDKTEFLAFLGIRFTTGAVLDYISYLAGLSKMNYLPFFFATLIATLPDALVYYFGQELYQRLFKNGFLFVGFLILVYVASYFSLKRKK